jgi:hypothetical protein
MSNISSNQLAALVTDALERTAFVVVDPCDEADGTTPPPDALHARIAYTGAEPGEVFVSASPGFLVELASSLLGVDEDDVALEAEGMDGLRELTNILGGSVLVAIGGEDHRFSLGLPEVLTDGAPTQGGGDVACALESMGEPLIVCWRAGVAKSAAA